MVKLTRIYTRGGDHGQTSLGDGARIAKHDLRVAAFGSVDESNAVIGLARLHSDEPLDALLARVQNDLFDVGADLCIPEPTSDDPPPKYEPLRVTPAQVTFLEAEIDGWNSQLAPLTSFILPGGSAASAHLHHARTVVRRAERDVSLLMAAATINSEVLRYLNRLSDLLFVLARSANLNDGGDVLWIPGSHR